MREFDLADFGFEVESTGEKVAADILAAHGGREAAMSHTIRQLKDAVADSHLLNTALFARVLEVLDKQ